MIRQENVDKLTDDEIVARFWENARTGTVEQAVAYGGSSDRHKRAMKRHFDSTVWKPLGMREVDQ